MRNSFTKFSNVLLVSSLSIYSNAADYKPQRLDEKKIYSNSEYDLNSVYSDIKGYISDNKNEVKYLVDTQCSWLKKALLHKPICKGFFSDIIFK